MAKIALQSIAILLVVVLTRVDAKAITAAKDIEPIGGFIMYRVLNNKIEYLLLKKVDEDDWSPPKGNLDANESVFDTAIRETTDETALRVCVDYDVHIQYKVYFEYETSKDVLKQVHLWPAELSNFEKPIELSPENSEFAWLEYTPARQIIKEQYRTALTQGDNIIRAHEQLSHAA